jgi:hypothetical protein
LSVHSKIMKNMLNKITLLIILILPSAHYCQTTSEIPFKKANTITIKTNLNVETAFKKWGRHLVMNGFSINKKDDTFLTLITNPKDTSKWNYDFIIFSTISDLGEIIIKIKFRLKRNVIVGTDSTDFYDWEYAKSKGNVQNVIYNDFIKTINSFGNFIVIYEKK